MKQEKIVAEQSIEKRLYNLKMENSKLSTAISEMKEAIVQTNQIVSKEKQDS